MRKLLSSTNELVNDDSGYTLLSLFGVNLATTVGCLRNQHVDLNKNI